MIVYLGDEGANRFERVCDLYLRDEGADGGLRGDGS